MNKKVSAIIAAGVLALGMGFGGCNPEKNLMTAEATAPVPSEKPFPFIRAVPVNSRGLRVPTKSA